jgi:RNA recognition motif-containing protein
VFVGNLHYDVTGDELRAVLSPAGTIVDLHVPTDRETGRPRGFAFVSFSTEAEAAEAIRRFNEFEVRGRRLLVNAAEERPRRPLGPRPEPFRPAFDGGGGFGGGGRPPKGRPRGKGSRRGLRRRKRSL